MTDLTCAEMVELVTDYLEGALSPVERRRFEAHIAACQGCVHYIEQMQQTIRLTGTLAEQHLSDAAKADLLRSLRDWKNSETGW